MDPVAAQLLSLARMAGGKLIDHIQQQRYDKARQDTINYLKARGMSLTGIFVDDYNKEVARLRFIRGPFKNEHEHKLYKLAMQIARIAQEEGNSAMAREWKNKAVKLLDEIEKNAKEMVSSAWSNVSMGTMSPGYSALAATRLEKEGKKDLEWVKRERRDLPQLLS